MVLEKGKKGGRKEERSVKQGRKTIFQKWSLGMSIRGGGGEEGRKLLVKGKEGGKKKPVLCTEKKKEAIRRRRRGTKKGEKKNRKSRNFWGVGEREGDGVFCGGEENTLAVMNTGGTQKKLDPFSCEEGRERNVYCQPLGKR